MNTEQRSNIIAKFTEIINSDRVVVLKGTLQQRTRYLTVVLDDIYLPQNASAIMRTSECLGIQSLHSIQERNKHKINRDVVKGAAKWTELDCYSDSTGRKACIENLKQQDYKIVAMTLSEDCIPLEELPVDKKLALCFGCEETGLSKELEDKADYKAQIPMHGFTQSYNVSVSAGICLYYLINKIKDTGQDWQLNKKEKEILLIDWLSKSTPTGSSLLEKYKEESE
ncbi:MAG: tRNA (guanosine-2'-O-)-methyltransferase [Gammaproteobacteria bacterium]